MGISSYWKNRFVPRPRRLRPVRTRPPVCEELEPRHLPSVSLITGSDPVQSITSFQAVTQKELLIPLRATDSDGAAVGFTATSSNPQVAAEIVTGTRDIRLTVSGTDQDGIPFSGDLLLRIFSDRAPTAVARVTELIAQGKYNNLTFHRIIDDFVAQGGDPNGDGTGGSGQDFADEFQPTLTFTSVGLLAMANAGDDDNDMQFFITDIDVGFDSLPQHLNFNHTILGQLVGGFDIFDKLIQTPTGANDQPDDTVAINLAQVVDDFANGILRVVAPAGFTGSTTINVTATGGGGAIDTEALTVQVSADTTNDRAFLSTVADQATTINTPLSFNLAGTDHENDSLTFVVRDPSTFGTPANVTVQVSGSRVTLTPRAGFSGTINLLAGVRDQTNRGSSLDDRSNFDTDQFTLTVTGSTTGNAIDLDSTSDNGIFLDDNYTSDDSPSFTITATPGRTLQVLVNGTVAATATETTSGIYTVSLPTGSMRVGENSVTVQGSDTALTPLTVLYAPNFQNVFVVPGDRGVAQSLTFNFTYHESAIHSEMGLYVVDDFTGRVGGVAPGEAGYARAALSSSTRQLLFSRGQREGGTQTLSFTGGQLLAFYFVADSTRDAFLASSGATVGAAGPIAFFSFPTANPDQIVHVLSAADPVTGNAMYHWEDLLGGGDRDYNDQIFTVKGPAQSTVQPGEALRVPAGPNRQVRTEVRLEGPVKARNGSSRAPSLTVGGELGVFLVDSGDGAIGGVLPGSSGYARAALNSSRQVLFNAGDAVGEVNDVTLSGNTLFGFYYIPGGTADSLLATNPENTASGSPTARFSFDAANPDGAAEHFRLFSPELVTQDIPAEGSLRVHVLDALFGSRSDFDDLVFNISFQSGE